MPASASIPSSSPLPQSRTLDRGTSGPVGRFLRGASSLVWCRSPRLAGTLHWGRIGAREAAELLRQLTLTLGPGLEKGFDLLVDARAVESLDEAAVSVISAYARAGMACWNERIHKQALVIAPGVVGAVTAGMLTLLGPRYPLRFFERMEDALAWLERPELPAALAEVARIVADVPELSPLLRALHAHLDRSLATANLDSAAQALGVSRRTLQRALHRLHTDFVRELTRARLRAACLRLEHSDDKVAAVAHAVGLSDSQLHLLFRDHVGETPAGYRARRRPR